MLLSVTIMCVSASAGAQGDAGGTPSATAVQLPPWLEGASGPPQRDAQALTAVQASLNAMGGIANIAALQTCVINIQADESAIGRAVGPLVLTVSGSQFRSDFQGPNGTVTLSTGGGTPFRVSKGKAVKVASHVTQAWFWPALVASELAAEFQNPNYSFVYKGNSSVDGTSVIVVSTILQSSRINSFVTPQNWYFDSSTALPVRVEYRLPDNKRPDLAQAGAADLSKYQNIGGILFPFQAVLWIGSKADGTRTIVSIEPNPAVTASDFAAPAGGLQ
ncbi:MAG TPA: hypothetical protein VIY69_12005 [Candidatus Acidoferrales bacterium]